MADNLYSPPIPRLPIWAKDPKVQSLANTFLDKYGATSQNQPWVGELPTTGVPQLPDNSSWLTRTKANISGGLSTVGQGIQSNASSVVPFISNIANSFRQVPAPIAPKMMSPITLNRVDNSNERAAIDQQTRGADRFADTNLDSNTAAAYRAANLSTKLRAYGDSYSKENSENASIGNQQAQINSGIEDRNTSSYNGYNDNITAMKIAQQRASSENLANASDKYVALQNAKAMRDLDAEKWSYASRLFGPGMSDRLEEYRKDPVAYNKRLQGQPELLGTKRALGGKLNSNSPLSMRKLKKVY